jgi:hypothetical protein
MLSSVSQKDLPMKDMEEKGLKKTVDGATTIVV